MLTSALLILNGEPPSKSTARALSKQADLIVAADGGANVAKKLGLRPDVIIGDLDSVTPATLRHFRSSEIVHDRSQETTDLEKAFGYLVRLNVRNVVITASTGRRIDFTLGNFVSIWKFVETLNILFCADDFVALPVRKSVQLKFPVGATVSLIPFSPCSGVTLSGFKYPLKNASLRDGATGLSNVIKRTPATISVRGGNLLAVVLS